MNGHAAYMDLSRVEIDPVSRAGNPVGVWSVAAGHPGRGGLGT